MALKDLKPKKLSESILSTTISAPQNKVSPSWMDEPFSATQTPSKTPVKYIVPEEANNIVIWGYPELKNEDGVKHNMPDKLKRAMVSDKDFACWFDTIWMVLQLNARWNLNEVIVPEHLRSLIGARSLCIDGNWKKPGEVKWSMHL